MIFLMVSANSIAQTNAALFHKEVTTQLDEIDRAVSEFNAAIVLYDGDTILAAYINLLTVTEKVISETENLSVPEGGADYQKTVLELFRFYLRTFESDYYEAVSIMYRIPVTDADIEEMERIFDRVELKETIFLNSFYSEQELFCQKNNLQE